MRELTIILWRDIPAQLMIGNGRKAIKYKLPEKYEQAIDRCAMAVGAKDAESYLQDWRKKIITIQSNELATLDEEAKKLELVYTDERLKCLVNNNGWDEDPKI